MDAEEYITDLIEAEWDGMVERAVWIHEHRPRYSHGMMMFGGEKARVLFDEAQLCYIYGLFSGTVMLGQSFIEQSICAMAYDSGEFAEDEMPGYRDAVKFLEENDFISPEAVEGVALDSLNDIRNSVAHFRNPSDETSLSRRMVESISEEELHSPLSDEILKKDAEKVLKTCFSVSNIFGVGYQSD